METRRLHAPDEAARRRADLRDLAASLSPEEAERRRRDRVATLAAVVQERALRFGGHHDSRERALVSLFYEGELAESDVRALTEYDHWQFLELLARHADLAPRYTDPFSSAPGPYHT